MKTKIKIFFACLLLPMAVMLVAFSPSKAGDFKNVSKDGPVAPLPDNAVGVIIGGVPHILQNRLKWTFQNGTPINSIEIKTWSGGYYMERRGTQIGALRVEKFPLSYDGSVIIFEHVTFNFCLPTSTGCNSGCEYDFIEQRCECDNVPNTGGCQLQTITLNPIDVIVI